MYFLGLGVCDVVINAFSVVTLSNHITWRCFFCMYTYAPRQNSLGAGHLPLEAYCGLSL